MIDVGEQTHRHWRSSFWKCMPRNNSMKAAHWRLAIYIDSVTIPNGWFWHGSSCKSVTTTSFMDKETSRCSATAAHAPPANREFHTWGSAAYLPSYALCRSYHVLDMLIWKIIALELRKSFRSLFFTLQASGSRVVSSRYFLMMGCLAYSIDCHDRDESLQRQLVWFQLRHSRLSLATRVLMIPFEFDARNHHAQSLHIVESPNFQKLSQGMQPMKWLGQLRGHAPSAACERSRLRKSLPHCQGAQWL